MYSSSYIQRESSHYLLIVSTITGGLIYFTTKSNAKYGFIAQVIGEEFEKVLETEIETDNAPIIISQVGQVSLPKENTFRTSLIQKAKSTTLLLGEGVSQVKVAAEFLRKRYKYKLHLEQVKSTIKFYNLDVPDSFLMRHYLHFCLTLILRRSGTVRFSKR